MLVVVHVQLAPTLLVQLALVEFDERAEERRLLAGQWLWHRGSRVSGRRGASTRFGYEQVAIGIEKSTHVQRDRRGLGWVGDDLVGAVEHRDNECGTSSRGIGGW